MYALEEEYRDQIDFLHVNVDEPDSLPLMEEYGFRSATPHLILYDRQGNLVRQWFGIVNREEVEIMFPIALE